MGEPAWVNLRTSFLALRSLSPQRLCVASETVLEARHATGFLPLPSPFDLPLSCSEPPDACYRRSSRSPWPGAPPPGRPRPSNP